jgi:hypothetical protein
MPLGRGVSVAVDLLCRRRRSMPRRGQTVKASALRISLLVGKDSGIQGIFEGLAKVEPHGLAGGNRDGLAGSRIPSLAGGTRRHIENAEAGKTDRLTGGEGIENGIHHGLDRLVRRRLV